MISGEVLEELWRRCSPDIKKQVEATAKMRIGKPDDHDVVMVDADAPPINKLEIDDRATTPIRSLFHKSLLRPRNRPAHTSQVELRTRKSWSH